VLLPLLVYQIWSVFRQCRHSRFGTLDYLCYLEVCKEKGSWFFIGLQVQIVLVILISICVFITACILLADNNAPWQDYAKVLVQVLVRAVVGCAKIPEMIWYDGPVRGKPHARMARYYLKNFYIKYSIFSDSRVVIRQILDILAMDPAVAEKILIEATYMEGDNRDDLQMMGDCCSRHKEGDEADRIADVKLLLEDGKSSDKLVRVAVGKNRGNRLGGGMGHINAQLMASLGQGYEKTPEDIGEQGEDTVPLREWAVDHMEQFPTFDENPRAAAAQRRLFELQWFFRDPHARKGLPTDTYNYEGPYASQGLPPGPPIAPAEPIEGEMEAANAT